MLFNLLFGLLPLLLVGGAIAGIVAVARRDDDAEVDEGIGTVRRLFLYGLTFAALMLALAGVALLAGGLFDALAGDTVIAESDTQLAIGLSLTLVGGVAWALLWLLAERTVARHGVERRSIARHVYHLAARGVTVAVATAALVAVVQWAFDTTAFQGEPFGFVVVWGAAWLFHLRIAEGDGATTPATGTLNRLYWFGAAAGALAMFAGGLGGTLNEFLREAYTAAFEPVLVSDPRTPLSIAARQAAAVAVVGGGVWAFHWMRARRDADSTLWRVYVFLGGLAGGIATSIIAASVLLYRVLQWFFGEPRETEAVAHFDVLPGALAALAVGIGLWGYHRAVLGERAAAAGERRSETERVYLYLAAAAGLVTLVLGLARVLATASDLLAEEGGTLLRGEGWWRNELVTGVTLLVVGVPLWLRYWSDVERRTEAAGAAERASLARRAFLYGVFGASALTTLIALSIVLFQLFEGILEGTLSREIFHDVRWPAALLLSAAGVSVYYLLVLRADQRALPAVAARPARPREVVLVSGDDGGALARRLEQRTGARVRVWRRMDGGGLAAISDEDFGALVSQIEATTGERLLIVVAPGGGGAVIPYSVA